MGNLTPLLLEQMTIDQALICLMGDPEPQTVSPGQAAAMGLVEPGGKTGVEMALEEAARQKKAKMREAKRRKRSMIATDPVNSQAEHE